LFFAEFSNNFLCSFVFLNMSAPTFRTSALSSSGSINTFADEQSNHSTLDDGSMTVCEKSIETSQERSTETESTCTDSISTVNTPSTYNLYKQTASSAATVKPESIIAEVHLPCHGKFIKLSF